MTEQWVFGLVDTSHEPVLGYKELATLLPITQPILSQTQSSTLGNVNHTLCTLWNLQQEYMHNTEKVTGIEPREV